MEETIVAADKTDPAERIIAVLATHSAITTEEIATLAGLAYSTTTPKLRALQERGLAERHKVEGRNLWRLTAADNDPSDPDVAEPDPVGDRGDTADPHENAQSRSHTDTDPSDIVAAHHSADEDAPDPADSATVPRDVDPDTSSGAPAIGDLAAEQDPDGDDVDGQDTTASTDAESDSGQPVGDPADGGQARPQPTPVPSEDGGHGEGVHAPQTKTPTTDGSGEPRRRWDAPRRRKGVLRSEILHYMRQHPDDTFKPSALSKALGGASSGAISNALDTLTHEGSVIRTADKPATYQAH